MGSDEDSSSYERRYQEEWQSPENRSISWEKIKFVAPNPCEKRVDINGKNLQVIVKLANIELTPENSRHPGGNWHVEGTQNEAIVATGIFYYSSSNITQSRLFFREAVSDPERYLQNDEEGVIQVYGIKNRGHLNQALGSVVTAENRCIVFPNIYQHRVSPFELEDKTKYGYRKILGFFLVDPDERVVSTKHVLPQQKDWRSADDQKGTMTLEEARRYREELMRTRKYAAYIYNYGEIVSMYEREFSLCEH